jgi:lysophospholipase L1-like esterase
MSKSAGALWSIRTVPAFINELGYRGESFPIVKPPGVVRVVVLGGSAAFDPGAERASDWPHLVEKELHSRGRSDVQVINAGIPGHASWDSLGRLYTEIWMLRPDYVLVYHGWNDAKSFGYLTPDRSLLRFQRPAPPSAVSDTLQKNPFIYYQGHVDRFLSHSQAYVRLRTGYWAWRLGKIELEGLIGTPPVLLEDLSPWAVEQYELNLRLIVETARAIGAEPILLTQARLPDSGNSSQDLTKIELDLAGLTHSALLDAFEAIDSVLVRVGHMLDVPLLDVAGPLNGVSEYFTDQVHTTPAGSTAIADRVATLFLGVLDDTVSGSPAAPPPPS